MIFPVDEKNEIQNSNDEDEKEPEDPILVPLAVPMQAGPSAMAYIILTATQFPEQKSLLLLAIFIASMICSVTLQLSDFLRKLLGNQALRAIERLMGMILTTMAIQMLLAGVMEYV